jgi:hypothetical protein
LGPRQRPATPTPRGGGLIGSPADDDPAQDGDIAYLARHQADGRIVVHIAGVHAIGSLGAAHYLTGHLAELFAQAGEQSFSAVIRSTFDGLAGHHRQRACRWPVPVVSAVHVRMAQLPPGGGDDALITTGDAVIMLDGRRRSSPCRSRRPSTAHSASAPRGALLYPRFSRAGLEGRFLGLMAYLEGKPEGDNSMVRREALYRIPCSAGRNLVECSWV